MSGQTGGSVSGAEDLMRRLVDLNMNKLVEIEVDLETLAREVGALEPRAGQWKELSRGSAGPDLKSQQ